MGSIDRLLALATAHPHIAWTPGSDIRDARNAHATNTSEQLASALGSAFDWLEGDVRLAADGRPIMQHESSDAGGLELGDWLRVAHASGRGVKVDVKSRDALHATIRATLMSGVPEHRLIFNLSDWSTADVIEVRRAFPAVMISISPAPGEELNPRALLRLQVAARVAGGAMMFAIRQDQLTPGVVAALRPFGRVAAWNSPGLTNPDPGDPARLRRMGVDAMIDLRQPQGPAQFISAAACETAAWVLGWPAVRDALRAVGQL
ncbi:MAG: hypothetical protein JWM86_763 [Thermoleophilia bacterium]|nr:hypothetical protein [Thermoleophilia bacterium]